MKLIWLGRAHQLYGILVLGISALDALQGALVWGWRGETHITPYLALSLASAAVVAGIGVYHVYAGRMIQRGYDMGPAFWSSAAATLLGGPLGVVLALGTLFVLRGGKNLTPEDDDPAWVEIDTPDGRLPKR